jgi:pyruvate dehydrogenase E2 component (dihydrolipoamide acetyltransferase)
MSTDCTVPELGENVESATVVEVLVKVGDAIRHEQSVLSLETDKAAFEMPSNVEGTVDTILVKAGDEVKVGQVVLRVGDGAAKPATPPSEAAKPSAAANKSSGQSKPRAPVTPEAEAKPEAEPDSEPELESAVRPKPSTRAASNAGAKSAAPAAEPAAPSSPSKAQQPATGVAASPSVRRLARERGIDLAKVSGSGPGGRVGAEDLAAHARGPQSTEAGGGTTETLPDFSRFGPVEVEPMSKVRARTAEQMARAWNSIPHVTHHDAADVTDLDRLRRQYAKRVEKSGGKLTMTAVLLKVLGSALRKFPKFNSSVDMAGHAIVYKKYVHIGVAVDTERGLLVPVIRDVDQMNIVEIALALREMSDKARNRNIRPDELQGAGFTITNLGGIGGRAFSPLINPPEVAVLGVSTARYEPFWNGTEFEPRQMLPLSVSYDHRVIDGADAARFLRWVCEALSEPFVMDLEGE